MHRVGLVVFLLLLLSCKKDPTSWKTQNSVPLLKSSLGIYDLMADSLLDTDPDSLVSIVYSNEIFNFGIDSLVDVEEDTVINSFSIAPIVQLDIAAGQQFYNQTEIISFDQVDASLSRAIIAGGELKLRASSTIGGDLILRVTIPNAKKNGESFIHEDIIPAANGNELGIIEETISMADFDLNLTGAEGSSYNEIEVNYSLFVPDYESQVTVYGTDEVSMEIILKDIEVDYVEGFLGSEEFDFDEKAYFENIPELNEAIVNLSEAKLNLELSNGFGVDLQAVIYHMSAENSATGLQEDLNHSLVGSNINLSRASYSQEILIPTQKSYVINDANSNITNLLEIIPDSIEISGRAVLNPLGNISNYNDFASSLSSFYCTANVKIPLRASFSNLVLRDTSGVDWNTENEISNLVFYLHANSTFKANAELSFQFVNDQGETLFYLEDFLLDGQSPLLLGTTNDTPSISTMVFKLGEPEIQLIEEADKILTELKFETTGFPDLVSIRSTDKINLLLSADVNAEFELK